MARHVESSWLWRIRAPESTKSRGLQANDILLDLATPRYCHSRKCTTFSEDAAFPSGNSPCRRRVDGPAGKNASASAAINKYLRDHELLPEGCTLYSLRHGFQDRLIKVEAPERLQADLMGHKTLRPKYGKGPSLEQMHSWLLKTALKPKNQENRPTKQL